MTKYILKRRQVSFRLTEEQTERLEYLNQRLPGYNIDVVSMCKDVALDAISVGIENIYKTHNIPILETPKRPEDKLLAVIRDAYKRTGIPLPKISEEEHTMLLENLKTMVSSS